MASLPIKDLWLPVALALWFGFPFGAGRVFDEFLFFLFVMLMVEAVVEQENYMQGIFYLLLAVVQVFWIFSKSL